MQIRSCCGSEQNAHGTKLHRETRASSMSESEQGASSSLLRLTPPFGPTIMVPLVCPRTPAKSASLLRALDWLSSVMPGHRTFTTNAVPSLQQPGRRERHLMPWKILRESRPVPQSVVDGVIGDTKDTPGSSAKPVFLEEPAPRRCCGVSAFR